MDVSIYSHDERFYPACGEVVNAWAEIIGAELRLVELEDLEGMPSCRTRLLILDADGMTDRELEILDEGRAGVEALFVCSRDSRQAIRCYSLRPTAFLGRSFSVLDLDGAMSRCISNWQGDLRYLEVTESRSRTRIPMCEILWVEAMGHRSLLHGMRREVQVSESLTELAAVLPPEVFVRCQRSYMVNLYHVKRTDGKGLVMSDGSAVAIGRAMRAEVQNAMARFQAGCLHRGTFAE